MSLPQRRVQRSFFEVPVMVTSLFDEKDRYRVFRERIMPALLERREELCKLYCEENGRPAIEPVILAGTTLLQFMEKVPDRKATEHVRLHLGWKYALELELEDPGFHATSLVKFRERLLKGEAERVVFDALLRALEEAGLVRRRAKQRLDSTHVLGCVSKMSRLEIVRETIRLFLEQMKRWRLTDRLANYSLLEERYCDSQIQWHRMSKETLTEKIEQAGRDALALIEWAGRQSAEVRESEKAQLLQRVFNEQYELVRDTPLACKNESSGLVKNPHDPEAQWAAKDLAKTKQWVGYKVQIAETVPEGEGAKRKGEPTEEFLTEVTTTEAIASDLDGMHRNLKAQAEHRGEKPPELYVDAAYITDGTLAEAKEEGRELIGPARRSGVAKEKVFDVEQFNVDTEKREAVCPAGHRSRQCSLINDRHKGDVYWRFEWAGLCDECQLRKECTQSKTGRRLLTVGLYHDLLQQRRREMKTNEFRERMHRRNAIEGTISEFVRSGGRRTRYRGLAKTALANYFLGAAVNAKRWIRLIQWKAGEEERCIATCTG